MKKIIKKTLAAITSALIILSCISCSSPAGVMSYGKSSITENEFRYYLATAKGNFSRTYSDYSDSASFFDMVIDDNGTTAEDFLLNSVLFNIKMTLICNELFDKYDLKLSDEVIDTVDNYIADFINEYADGNTNVFNNALAEFGINAKMLREIYLKDERAYSLFNYLFSSNGPLKVTDSDREDYLDENYVRVRHIYVNNKYKYVYNEDGKPVYSTSGTQQTAPLNEDELAAKNALISAIDESIAEGGDFEEIYNAFSEDKLYKNGYYFTRTTDFIDSVVSSAFELEIGEYVKIESDVGTHYIKRLEMNEKPWADESNADFFDGFDTTISNRIFSDHIGSFLDDVVINEELIDKYSLKDSPTNYKF
ncbi:MAG: hypothetical protein E7672_05720 [Ruminococcaceae bacterium]|nr:hypothetical protein [Oscillospiraceae bacterium]